MFMYSNKAKILVCQLDESMKIVESSAVTVEHSLVSCLNEATTKAYDLIILCFSTRSIGARPGIIELCRCLKGQPLTIKTPIFASIDRWHRTLAGRLKKAGLDLMNIRQSQNRIDPEHITGCLLKTGKSVHISKIMSQLCPFLNYTPLNDCCELTTCGAWHNRMVLGGQRLHEVCETENHPYCENFLNPRLNP